LYSLDEAKKAHWNRLAGKMHFNGFNFFISSGMKEFEAECRVLDIKASIRSSRRFVRVKARMTYDAEWHELLLHALIISSAFQYRRE